MRNKMFVFLTLFSQAENVCRTHCKAHVMLFQFIYVSLILYFNLFTQFQEMLINLRSTSDRKKPKYPSTLYVTLQKITDSRMISSLYPDRLAPSYNPALKQYMDNVIASTAVEEVGYNYVMCCGWRSRVGTCFIFSYSQIVVY